MVRNLPLNICISSIICACYLNVYRLKMLVCEKLFRSIIGMLSASISCGFSSQFTQQAELTQFQELRSADDSPACSVSVTPYKSYSVDSVICCTYDCKTLKRQTSNSVNCVGFNYRDDVNTCQLFTNRQRLYFSVRSGCRYFMVSSLKT
jgi:hypothetical protein